MPRVSLETESVRFEAVDRFDTHEAIVVVRNTGTGEARVTASVEAPFRIRPDARTVAPDADGTFTVTWSPADYADATGQLALDWDGDEDLRLGVSGTVDPDSDGDGVEAEAVGGTDCDDDDPERFPGRAETCDGVDNDCDEVIDEDATDASTWFRDADGDGYGDAATSTRACAAPVGHVADDTDCDDTTATIYPGRTERRDAIDNDCDGRVDEHLMTAGSLVLTELHPGDGAGVPAYVELVSRSDFMLYLDGVVVDVGGTSHVLGRDLPVDVDETVLLCGTDDAGEVDGRACAAPLPGDPSQGLVSVTAEVLVDEVDAGGLPFAPASSVELAPDRLDADDNDVVGSWCTAVAPLGEGAGTPGETSTHCPDRR